MRQHGFTLAPNQKKKDRRGIQRADKQAKAIRDYYLNASLEVLLSSYSHDVAAGANPSKFCRGPCEAKG
jgi:hypothetical protein